jgi:hypothetical protein
MISPLIKWDHGDTYFVTRYEDNAKKTEWLFSINISDPDYDFANGHLIDGELRSSDCNLGSNIPVIL